MYFSTVMWWSLVPNSDLALQTPCNLAKSRVHKHGDLKTKALVTNVMNT